MTEGRPLAVDVRRLSWRVGLLIALALLTTLGGVGMSEHLRALNNGQARPAVAANETLLKDTLAASTGLRGFLIDGNDAFLAPPTPDPAGLRADLERLRSTGGDDPTIEQQAEALGAWITYRDRLVAAKSAGEDAPDQVSSGPLNRFQTANGATHAALQGEVDRLARLTGWSIIGSSGLLTFELALLALLVHGMRRELDVAVVGPLEDLRDVVEAPHLRADTHRGPTEIRALARVVNHHLDAGDRAAAEARLEARLNAVKDDAALAVRRALDIPVVLAELERGLVAAFPRATARVVSRDAEPATWLRAEQATRERGVRVAVQHADEHGEARLAAFVASEDGPAALVLVDEHGPRMWHRREVQLVEQLCDFASRGVDQARFDEARAATIDRLETLDRQKTDFMATVSHELRTPLTSIAGYLELLEDGDYGSLNDEQAHVVDVVSRNTARLRSLIEDLLVLSRIEANGVELDVAPFDLALLVDIVVENLSPQAAEGKVAIVRAPGEPTAMMVGDHTHVERALTNVIGNAVKFTPDGGLVEVGVHRAPGAFEVVVTDNGIGIPQADLEDVGRRFFRASNVTAQTIPGTGLGLSIVRAIAEAHHGELQITSRTGVGTTVVLTLADA